MYVCFSKETIIPSTPKVILSEKQAAYSEDEMDFPVMEKHSSGLSSKAQHDFHKAQDGLEALKGDINKPGYRFSVGQLPAWAKKQVYLYSLCILLKHSLKPF